MKRNDYTESVGQGENEKVNDPFYSEENMAHLKNVIEDIESGKAVLSEHELIED